MRQIYGWRVAMWALIVLATILCMATWHGRAHAQVVSSSGGGGGPITASDGAITGIGTIGENPWTGTGNGDLIAIAKAAYLGIIAPIAPCAAANCGNANPIGAVLAGRIAEQFTSTSPSNGALVINAAACSFNNASLFSSVSGYMLVLDATSVPVSPSTVTPIKVFPVQANTTTMLTSTPGPRPNSNGLVVLYSSTGPYTYTAPSSGTFWADGSCT